MHVAGGGSAVPRIVVPRPAPNHRTLQIAAPHPRTPITGCSLIAIVPHVFAPLPHVPTHVEQAELVGAKRPYRRRFPSILPLPPLPIRVVPAVIRLIRRDRLPEVKRCGRSRPAGELLLGLRRQTYVLTRLLRQSAAEVPALLPGNLLNGPIIPLEVRRILAYCRSPTALKGKEKAEVGRTRRSALRKTGLTRSWRMP